MFDDYGNYKGPRNYGGGGTPFDDDLDDVFPVKGKGYAPEKPATVYQYPGSRAAQPAVPYWIRSNMESIKACVDRMGAGRRPITDGDKVSLATYLMLMFGDLAEKSADLIWTTTGKEIVRRAIIESLEHFCFYRGGVHTKIVSGEEVDGPKFTGPVAEQLLVDALASQGVTDEVVALSVLDYLQEHGVRLMAEEDIEEEKIKVKVEEKPKASPPSSEDVGVVTHVEQDPVSEGKSDDEDDDGGFMAGVVG